MPHRSSMARYAPRSAVLAPEIIERLANRAKVLILRDRADGHIPAARAFVTLQDHVDANTYFLTDDGNYDEELADFADRYGDDAMNVLNDNHGAAIDIVDRWLAGGALAPKRMRGRKANAGRFKAGTMVGATYRRPAPLQAWVHPKFSGNAADPGHGWTGEVLEVDDPAAWAGSLAFPGTPTREDVQRHIAEVEKRARDRGLGVSWNDKTPVRWEFGRVDWDSDRELFPVHGPVEPRKPNRAALPAELARDWRSPQTDLLYRVTPTPRGYRTEVQWAGSFRGIRAAGRSVFDRLARASHESLAASTLAASAMVREFEGAFLRELDTKLNGRKHNGVTRPPAARHGAAGASSGRFVITFDGQAVAVVPTEGGNLTSRQDIERAHTAASRQLALVLEHARQNPELYGSVITCVWDGPRTRWADTRRTALKPGHLLANYTVYPQD